MSDEIKEVFPDITKQLITPDNNNFGILQSGFKLDDNSFFYPRQGNYSKIYTLPYYSKNYLLNDDLYVLVKNYPTSYCNASWILPVFCDNFITSKNSYYYHLAGIKSGSIPSFKSIYGLTGPCSSAQMSAFKNRITTDWPSSIRGLADSLSNSIWIFPRKDSIKIRVGYTEIDGSGKVTLSSGYSEKKYSASDFDGNIIPDRLFLLLQAGGGGGASGSVVAGRDGQGGASGCCALICLNIAEMIDSVDKRRKTPQGQYYDGYVVLIGGGGREQSTTGSDGHDGESSYIYSVGVDSPGVNYYAVGGWKIFPGGGGKFNSGTAYVVRDAGVPGNYNNAYYQGWSSNAYSSVIWSISGLSCGTQDPSSSSLINLSPYEGKNIFDNIPSAAHISLGNYSKGSNGDYGSGGGSASYFGNGGNAGSIGDVQGKSGDLGAGGGGGRYVFAGNPWGGEGGAGLAIIFY